MKKIQLILIYIFTATITNAQNYQWANNIGGNNFSYGYSIALDGAGNCYITGGFMGTADFDPGPGIANLTSAGNDDIFVAKYNSSGVYQWAFKIGGVNSDEGFGIAVDASSNVYITGNFRNTIDFDPGAGTANLTPLGSDIFVAKYNSAGVYQWAFNIGGAGDEGVNSAIAVDGSGNVYITGCFWFTADFDPGPGTANLTATNLDIYVAKYNTSGAYQWAFNIGGGGDDYCLAITTDASSNVYCTGYFEGTADFNPGVGVANLTSVGSFDSFVAKYNSSGVYQWAFNIGSNSTDFGISIALDGSNNVYVTGEFLNTADFDPGPGTANLTSSGSYDVYVAKYNSSGAYQWAFNIASNSVEYVFGIDIDNSNNIYIIGQFQNLCDFDPGAGIANLPVAGGTDLFIAKYNSAGAYQWAFGIGGTGIDRGNAIVVDGTCNFYTTGYFQSTVDFDPSIGTANLTSMASYDIFVAKYSDCPPPIIADFSASDSTICAGSCINFADSSIGSPTSWNWSFPGSSSPTSNLQNPTNICYANAGTYPVTLIVTNLTSADTITHNILVSPLPVISAIAVSDTVCNGSCTNITASGAATYTWMPGSLTGATVNVCPSATTIFSVVGISLAGCIDSSTIKITVVANPTVNAIAVSDTICSGSCTDLTASGASTYTWMPGGLTGTTVNVCPTTTTIYTVVGSLMAGCVDSSTIQITVHQTPTVTATAVSDTLCAGSCTDLSASGAATYIWLPGSLTGSTVNVCPASSTTYSVSGSTLGCSDSSSVTVIVNPLPIASIVGDTNICFGETATLTASGGTFYEWDNAVTTPTVIVSPSSTYTYTVTVTTNGCTDSVSITVHVSPLPTADAGNDTTIISGASVQLNGSGGVTYAWSPSNGLSCTNCTNPIASPTDTTTYILTVTDANGCTDVDTVVVNVIKEIVDCGDVFVPNAFSPNNDGINDTLFVRGKCISTMEFCIYNRWGEKVFESNNISTGWNGKYKNGTRNTGVYVWYLIATMDDGTVVNKKGNVTLFR